MYNKDNKNETNLVQVNFQIQNEKIYISES